MSDFKKGDIVRYQDKEYTVENVRHLKFGEHEREKLVLIDKDGQRTWADEKDVKPIEKIKRLSALIDEAKKEQAKEERKPEQVKEQEKGKREQGIKETKRAAKEVSFSVYFKDGVDSRSDKHLSKEIVVTGTTKDGVHYKANVYGEGAKGDIDKIANAVALNHDLADTHQKESYEFDALSRLRSGDVDLDTVVVANGRVYTALEANDDTYLEECENLEDYGVLDLDELEDDFETVSTGSASSLADLAREAGVSEGYGGYSSPGYDDPEEEYDELLELSGVEDITSR